MVVFLGYFKAGLSSLIHIVLVFSVALELLVNKTITN